MLETERVGELFGAVMGMLIDFFSRTESADDSMRLNIRILQPLPELGPLAKAYPGLGLILIGLLSRVQLGIILELMVPALMAGNWRDAFIQDQFLSRIPRLQGCLLSSWLMKKKKRVMLDVGFSIRDWGFKTVSRGMYAGTDLRRSFSQSFCLHGRRPLRIGKGWDVGSSVNFSAEGHNVIM